jgi:hypothetical protein
MSKSEDVINRAYGPIAKEVSPIIEINIFPSYRSIRYYWLMLVRRFTR